MIQCMPKLVIYVISKKLYEIERNGSRAARQIKRHGRHEQRLLELGP